MSTAEIDNILTYYNQGSSVKSKLIETGGGGGIVCSIVLLIA
jgi:hypothetical protein